MSEQETVRGIDPATGAGLAVTIEDGHVAAIEAGPADGPFLCAGLIDLQVNGYGGLDLNDGALTPAGVLRLAEDLARLGVTTFLPTFITASEARIVAGLRAVAEARRLHPLVADMVPGVHVEGPSISPLEGPRGAHPLAHVRPPSLAEFERWQAACENLVTMVTLAPESADAVPYIQALVARKIHVALGHSAATPEQIRDAAEAGARLSTHLGNGASATLPRHPNMIWAQLADDRLTASFIADGHHLPADTFKSMLRAKGLGRAVLVSDTVALAGLAPGRYRQAVGDDVVLTADGRVGIAGTPYLAGAARPLCADVAIAARMAGLSLADALALATEAPGRFVGGRGRLDVGARADLMLFDWAPGADALEVRAVWVAGRRVAGA